MVTEVRVGASRALSPAENNTECSQQHTDNITAENILLLYIFKETTPGFPVCTLKRYERARVHPNLTPVFYIVGCIRLNF